MPTVLPRYLPNSQTPLTSSSRSYGLGNKRFPFSSRRHHKYSKEDKPITLLLRTFAARYCRFFLFIGAFVILCLFMVYYHYNSISVSQRIKSYTQIRSTDDSHKQTDALPIELEPEAEIKIIVPNQEVVVSVLPDEPNDISTLFGEDSFRLNTVRDEFIYAWTAYSTYAFGFDDYHPVSKQATNGYRMGLTLIDSMDTLILMQLHDEYERCRSWVDESLHFTNQANVNVFESTIRVIGGLLSVHAFKGDMLFLNKARELADKLLVAFDSPSKIPFGTVTLDPNQAFNPAWSGGVSSTSEGGSIQLEWRYLSDQTGNPVYSKVVDEAFAALNAVQRPRGLFTRFVNPNTGQSTDNVITLGARVDSIYEYYLKMWLQSGQTDLIAKRRYDESMDAIRSELLVYTHGVHQYAYFQEIHADSPHAKMDHLVCFMPGLLALGAQADSTRHDADMDLAKQLMITCVAAYTNTPTNIAPEIMLFDIDHHEITVDPGAKHNLLRPETVESLFILWRVTHEQIYREWGWMIFQAFIKYCKLPDGAGYSGLHDVNEATNIPQNWNDHMESFFLGETLKYLYLLFSDDSVLPLNEWVFNTEAHPLPINSSSIHDDILIDELINMANDDDDDDDENDDDMMNGISETSTQLLEK